MNSTRTRRISWILAAAVTVGGFGAAASTALAQQRVGSDGRALDANNRIGSGGINDAPARGPISGVGGNQIVTGNVTGGQQFRGFVPYTDPFAFRGATAGVSSDRFIRESSGVPIPGVTTNDNAGLVRPFYGASQTVERPPGYTLEAPGTGFVPAAPRISRDPGDLRLGRTFDTPVAITPQPGQLILPGPVDPTSQQPTVITASPLYGVRQWNFGDAADQRFLNGLNVPPTQRARLDDRALQRLREQMTSDLQPDALPGEEGRDGQQQRDRINNDMGTQQFSLSLQDARVQNRVENTFETDVRPGNLSINTPQRQSAQYAEMQRRLNQFNQLPEAVAQWREHQLEQARQRGEDQAQPDAVARRPLPGDPAAPADGATAQPGTGSGTGADAQARRPGMPDTGLPDYQQRSKDILEGRDRPDDPTDLTGDQPDRTARRDPARDQAATPDPTRPQPLQVNSLATGVQTKAVADFLKEAEGLMREGKFYSALDQYDLADQVAPNDPMVNLGRAIAELGASYYARADQHLREAFTRSPALLMAQYDLRGFLGQERLEFLVNDLRAISNKEATEPRSVFLLAFIDYNTGNPRRAAAYLDLAERRAGKPDPLYQNMRKYWSLPAAGEGAPADNANK